MKLVTLPVLSFGLLVATASVAAPPIMQSSAIPTNVPQARIKLNSEMEKVSYSIGVDLGKTLKEHNLDINAAALSQGLNDGLVGKSQLSQEQIMTTLKTFQQQLITKKQEEMKMASEKNKQEGNDYLAANKTKPGVITTASGIQYKIISAGSGDSPTAKDTVNVDYTGTFVNGKIFDSSTKPVTFPVAEVIPGWTEILQLMKPGAIFEVVIPPQLAYGEQGVNKAIGPNQTLLFKIHLISVKKTN